MFSKRCEAKNDSSYILQVIDSGHKDWVLGGIFSDLRLSSHIFSRFVLQMPNWRQLANPLKVSKALLLLHKYDYLLFSSITPLTNYLRVTPKNRRKDMFLWFTHSPSRFSEFEIYALNQPRVIYVHSKKAKLELSKLTKSRIEIMIGAIGSERFAKPAEHGERIAWVGTTASRKCPELFLSIAEENPDIDFRLLGKNWALSKFWSQVESLQNIQYVEIEGPLVSESFAGCDIFLSTSKLEGGPMPLMESLAAGLTPLVTNTGFVDDLFEICDLPRELILPSVDGFRSRVISIRSNNKIDVNRKAVMNYDFKKLARLIEGTLIP